MSVFKCKMCGGNLEVVAGSSVVTCEYCGTNQTISKTRDEVIQNLFNRANDLRIKCEFDRAEQTYEKILEQDNSEAEAHWGIVLCQYGIEYVEDPATKKRIPTCHRTSYESIITNADFIAAINNADDEQKEVYNREAKEIDTIQKDILSIVKNEEPFDVFICYKETDDSGKRTIDSTIANDIYYQLVQEGFKVFYAPITLEDKLGREYEPYIFAALNSAKVMLVVGTKSEYFNAVWVKNEWSRYLKILKADRTKLLIPCYKDMDAYDLPDEFAHLQSQDMSKIGFIQDLIRGINKVITKEVPVSKKEEVPPVETKQEPERPRLMVIEDVFTITGRGTVITGCIENGTINVNETVVINNIPFVVTGIEQFRKIVNSASAGMSVGILLRGATKDNCRAGDVVYKEGGNSSSFTAPPPATTPDDIARELLNAGYHDKKIEAIKILRERTGLGLADAKNVIDRVFAAAGYGTYNPNQKSGGCYVATCVYGSYDCPQVWTLRRFRDNTLASTWYGRAFIRTYYAISPTIVKWFGNTQWFKKLWKNKLDKMVSELRSNGVEDTPYQDTDWR
ncbi:MAG: TIR domain-containing protein [Ruminococcaceae bacterium]|nr:TIR domain-containing protein [Oscillospiraceae bacterium]